MKVDDIFVKCVLTEIIKLSPRELHKNYQARILEILKEKVEGKCTRHGYIKRGSLELIAIQMGTIEAQTFAGFTNFSVKFRVDVCYPSEGMIVTGKVNSINQFGILCMCSYSEAPFGRVDVLHIIIPKQAVMIRSDINLMNIKVGDTVNIELLKKKCEPNDTKIMAVGKIVKWTANMKERKVVSAISTVQEGIPQGDGNEEEDDDDVDLEDLGEEEEDDEENEDREENEEGDEDDDDPTDNVAEEDVTTLVAKTQGEGEEDEEDEDAQSDDDDFGLASDEEGGADDGADL